MTASIFHSALNRVDYQAHVVARELRFDQDRHQFCLVHEYTLADFLILVQDISEQFQSTHTVCLLASKHPLIFLAGFFAACSRRLAIAIPPNFLPATLTQFDDASTYCVKRDQIDCESLLQRRGHASSFVSIIDPALQKISVYTSGTSGQPQQIVKTLRQFEAEIFALDALWQMPADLAARFVVATVPHYHIYGLLFRLLLPFYQGNTIVTHGCETPHEVLALTEVLGDVDVISSPSQLARFDDLVGCASFGSNVRFFSSGGLLESPTAQRFAVAGHYPYEVYGSTETGGIAWRQQMKNTGWQALPEVVVHTDQPDGRLSLRSPWASEPACQLVQCADMFEMQVDGTFLLKGRSDRVVKIGEKRIDLQQLEASLAQSVYIERGVAILLQKRRVHLGVVAVLSREGLLRYQQLGRVEFIAYVRHWLGQYYDLVLIPRYWRFVDSLPYDERGKLTQHVLEGLFQDE